uniref:Uncharacterized protein n=1 Tax=Pristionchus pacificus TaxID=54126 RepID=A0A2A6BFA6_PRIPA|eukprot:PDM64548.1 hypothetical protein PRIPAC_52804 [Pristionchus pacificus]
MRFFCTVRACIEEATSGSCGGGEYDDEQLGGCCILDRSLPYLFVAQMGGQEGGWLGGWLRIGVEYEMRLLTEIVQWRVELFTVATLEK